jgi:HEAT repeat protein
MLAIDAEFQALLDLYNEARPKCLAVARRLIADEPRVDALLFEFLQQRGFDDSVVHSGLEILDFISPGDRLVPAFLKLVKHPNPKIRARAALFIGSRSQEYDDRVRANVIESLYGTNSEFVRQIFRGNASDANNRVAGNAILGLYLLGDASAIRLIRGLAHHPDARFRNTGAWVMGRTKDAQFEPPLLELMNDSDELVRAQAFKGYREVRKAVSGVAS